ncbi:hypothetical protein Pla123a_00080 [Posidoniimonas polymericola]|uniref:Zinc ribbon domain protein n=1 Tax=Posidoniimonas polymericola TaxID=2528002 RepID=A0A5C5ZD04_9BACT|nr:hypothetical protein [Posidoniimonas polymericola]TWT85202.1 hypothetical protein Pla123a_00080 [Posidoniimonas polymericola]
MSHSDLPPAFEFDCPLCGGAFEADLAMLGQEVECPHCDRVVELPQPSEMQPSELPPGELQPDGPPSENSGQAQPEPAGASQSAAPATRDEPPSRAAAEPAAATESRPLTREERAAARRRLNLTLAAVGAVILIATFVLLVNLS